jgi:hypothetical protein
LVAISLFGILVTLIAGVLLFVASRLDREAKQTAAVRDAALIHDALAKLTRTCTGVEIRNDSAIHIGRAYADDVVLDRDTSGHLLWNGEAFPAPALAVDTLLLSVAGADFKISIGARSAAGYIQLEVPFRRAAEWVPRRRPAGTAAFEASGGSR